MKDTGTGRESELRLRSRKLSYYEFYHNIPLGRPRWTLEDNIKTDLIWHGCEDVNGSGRLSSFSRIWVGRRRFAEGFARAVTNFLKCLNQLKIYCSVRLFYHAMSHLYMHHAFSTATKLRWGKCVTACCMLST